MKWIKTDTGTWINMENVNFINIKMIYSSETCEETIYRIQADCGHSLVSIEMGEGNINYAQKRLDSIMEMVRCL